MKRLFQIMKKIMLIAGLTGLVCSIVFLLVVSNEYQDAVVFKKLNIDIDHRNGLFFVSEKDIQAVFYHLNPDTSKAITDINLYAFEKKLKQNPFIKQAQVFTDMKGTIYVTVVQKQPLLRIINNNGVSYYLDENGNKMPLSNNFTSRVPVATGFIETTGQLHRDSAVLKQLFDLISFIHSDDLLLAMCEQIDVSEKGEFEFIPKMSRHRFLLGDASELDKKFERMKIFYTEVMPCDSVHRFTTVNVKYNNQIICTKNI